VRPWRSEGVAPGSILAQGHTSPSASQYRSLPSWRDTTERERRERRRQKRRRDEREREREGEKERRGHKLRPRGHFFFLSFFLPDDEIWIVNKRDKTGIQKGTLNFPRDPGPGSLFRPREEKTGIGSIWIVKD